MYFCCKQIDKKPQFNSKGNITYDDYTLVNPKIISYIEKRSHLKGGEECLSINEETQDKKIKIIKSFLIVLKSIKNT